MPADFEDRRFLVPDEMYDLNDRRVHDTDYEDEGKSTFRSPAPYCKREHEAVLAICEEKLRKNPSDRESKITKAFMLYNLMSDDLFRYTSERYLDRRPAYPTNRAELALQWFTVLEKTMPLDSEPELKAKLLWLKGKLLLTLHRYEEAITAFNLSFAITIETNPGWAYFKRGQAFVSYPKDTPDAYKQRFAKQCCSDLEKAMAYYPSDMEKQRYCSNIIHWRKNTI